MYFEDYFFTPNATAFLQRVIQVSSQPPWNITLTPPVSYFNLLSKVYLRMSGTCLSQIIGLYEREDISGTFDLPAVFSFLFLHFEKSATSELD
jgi:hypothetical protein